MVEEAKFVISQSLHGHEQDVRAVVVCNNNLIASASRDKSIKVWLRKQDQKFVLHQTLLGHQHFINALAFMPPKPEWPSGLLISGSMDQLILVWDLLRPEEPLYTLIGHTDTVSCLDTKNDLIVSGSWDRTVRIWKDYQCVGELKGHEQAIWAVRILNEGEILSASADKTIKLWKNGKCLKTFKGHSDVVRGLDIVPEGFISCSNDGSIKLWSLDGDCLKEMFGHTSFIYQVAHLRTGEFISSSEDKTCRVWKNYSCLQTIVHPTQTVWCCAGLPNGDIVTGSNDGILRIFTRDNERKAEPLELQNYEASIEQSTVNANQLGDVDKSKLPDASALNEPGKKDQEVKMIKNGDKVEAHQWNQTSKEWVKLGEVVDAVGQNRKQIFDGKEYDYVFDVDIGDNMPALKLPYNASENPYQAAQSFITKNELPQDYLDQVANFILKNTQGAQLGFGSNGPSDPYTGQGRYIPGTTAPAPTTSISNDPYHSNQKTTSSANKIIPVDENGYLTFETANLAGIQKKIHEFSTELKTVGDQKSLDAVFLFLSNPKTVSSHFGNSEFKTIVNMLSEWPKDKIFPVLDCLRLLILHSKVPVDYPFTNGNLVTFLLEKTEFENVKNSSEVNVMLSLRCICNLFQQQKGISFLLEHSEKILNTLNDYRTEKHANKQLFLALVTCLLNFSVMSIWVKNDPDFSLQLLSVLIECLPLTSDSETLYRASVAIGNLLFKYKDLRQAAVLLNLPEYGNQYLLNNEDRLKFIWQELKSFLSQQ